MDAALEFARQVATLKYEDLPAEVVEVTKKDILDLLGVALAGSTKGPGCRELVELVKEAGGKQESSIIGFGGRVPAWMAAFANGGIAHSLDFDTYRQEAGAHAAICTVPAAFATAERVGNISGKEFIAAIALGNDIAYRLALAVIEGWKRRLDWVPTSLHGPWGATAASARLLGLDAERVADAFGIALHQVAGTREMSGGLGSTIRALYASFPAKTGVLSALMAQRGITGGKESLEGKAGFLQVYFGGDYDRARLTDQLGKKFEGVHATFKRWPCCAGSHPLIDAALRIVRANDLDPGDIEEIGAFVTSSFQMALCQPLEERRRPRTAADATFSIPFVVATAVAKKRVTIADFTPEALKDSLVLDLARKVVPKAGPGLSDPPASGQGGGQVGSGGGNLYSYGKVEILMRTGEHYSEQVDFTPGHPDSFVRMDEIVQKFRDCACYSAKPIPQENIEKVIEMAEGLEDVDDVSQIIRLIS